METKRDINTLIKSAANFYKKNKYKEALQCYSEVLFDSTTTVDNKIVLYKNQGACYVRLEKYTEAASAYTNCLELKLDDKKALLRRCEVFEKMERYDEAYRDAVKLIQMNPDDPEAQAAINRLDPIVKKSQEGYGSSSEENQPNNSTVNNQPPATIPKTLPSKQRDGSKMKKKGRQLFNEGKFIEALELYKEGVNTEGIPADDRAVFYKNQAACYIRLERYCEAVTACDKCLELEPKDVKALYRRCQANEKMEKYEDAHKDAKTVLAVDPKNDSIQPILLRLQTVLNKSKQNPNPVTTVDVYKDKDKEVIPVYDCKQQEGTDYTESVKKLQGYVVEAIHAHSEKHDTTHALYKLDCGEMFGQSLLKQLTGLPSDDNTVKQVRTILSDLHKLKCRLHFALENFSESFNQFEKALQACYYQRPDLFGEYMTSFLPVIVINLQDTGHIQEMKNIFKRQKASRNSEIFEVWTCGYHTAIRFADALRKEGETGYDNELLKNLYLEQAIKILEYGFEMLYFTAAESCEKALEYSNGKDFEVLRISALVYNQVGNTKKAMEYCKEALKLQPNNGELHYLHIELETELSDMSDTLSVAESVASAKSDDQPDEDWLPQNVRAIEKQRECRARQIEAHSKTKRKGSSRRRPNRVRRQEEEAKVQEQSNVPQCSQKDDAIPNTDNDTNNNTAKIPENNAASRQVNGLKTAVSDSHKQRRKPKMTSKRIFYSIIEDYEVQLACDQCWIKESDIPDCQYVDIPHACKRNKLLMRNRTGGNSSWQNIRQNPLNFQGEEDLCEDVEAGNPCSKKSKCKYPHSVSEKLVWNYCCNQKWNIEALINDLRDTNLRLIAILSEIPAIVSLFLGCKKCIMEHKYDTCKKVNAHTPECHGNHVWNKSSAVAMIEVNEENIQPLKNATVSLFDGLEMSPNAEKVTKSLLDLAELLKQDFNSVEVVQQCDILRKQKKAKSSKLLQHPSVQRLRGGPRLNSRSRNSSSSSHASIEEEYEEPKFDTYFDDIMSSEDIDDFKVSNAGDEDNLEEYYTQEPVERLEELLEKHPERYKKCTISLSGTQKAKCFPIDDASVVSIEIRGRMNCGKSLDGDVVVVEVMNVDMLDSEEKVQRGRVVGVLLETCNRKAYNFICTVDGHFSNLMVPICGKAPKIHIEDSEIKNKDDKVRNRLVCVYENNGGKIEYKNKVQINPKDRHNQLFLVKYEKWAGRYMYPYGYVAKVLEPGKSIETGQRILDLMFQVPPGYDKRIQQYLNARFSDGLFPDNAYLRYDCTEEYVISIDPPDCTDIDDALSVSRIPGPGGDTDCLFKIGIHIADVSNFIEKDDEVDEEAAKRRISFYPADKSTECGGQHMLPAILSTDVCSLVEGKERYALSLFVVMNSEGEVQQKPFFRQTKIVNKKKMTYSEAQLLIEGGSGGSDSDSDNDKARGTVYTLHTLAQQLKRHRLENAMNHREIENIAEECDHATDAHELIAEFMIYANSYTAEFLVDKYDNKALIRKQTAPTYKTMSSWREKHENVISGSFFFDRYCGKESVVAFDFPCCEEVHEAFSVSLVPATDSPNGYVYRVAIHIADRPIYRVKSQGHSYRGCGRPYLLEDNCSEDVNTFIEEGESHSLSVYVNVNEDGSVQDRPQFKETKMKYQDKLSLEEAQEIIMSEASKDEDEPGRTLRLLHQVAWKLKAQRFGNIHEKFFRNRACSAEAAVDIVKEFLILSNRYAGDFVYNKYGITEQGKSKKSGRIASEEPLVNNINENDEYLLSVDPPRGTDDIYEALSVSMVLGRDEKKRLYRLGIHIFDVTIIRNRDNELDVEAAKRRFKLYAAYKLRNLGGLQISPEREQVSENIRKREQFLLSLFIDVDERGHVMGGPQFKYTRLGTDRHRKVSIENFHKLITTPNLNGDRETCEVLNVLNRLAQNMREGRNIGEMHWIKPETLVDEFMILIDQYCGQESSPDLFYLLKTTSDDLQFALRKQDPDEIIKVITTENIHPSYTLASNDWLDMQHTAEVTLYSDKMRNDHFSLQKDLYTWFTSPIRRFIDIVVHRMILAAIQDKNRCQSPYTKAELEEICKKFNSTHKRQRQHDRAGKVLVAAQFLQGTPAYFPSVVTSFDSEDGIEFCWPLLPHMKKDQRNLKLRCFSVCDKPEVTDSFMKIHWQKRIYDVMTHLVPHARNMYASKLKESVPIDHKKHITGVDRWMWDRLVEAINEEEPTENLMIMVGILLNDAKEKRQVYQTNRLQTDVTSEMKHPWKIVNHHVKFNMAVEQASVVQLQLGSIYKKGLIEPQINLYSVTPTLDICIEHMRDPVHSFSEVATQSHKQAYTSVHDYKQTWLPMLSMEAASNAVQEGDPIIINNVGVELRKTKQSFTGVFEVPKAFCQHRQINFFYNNKDKNESELEEKDESEDYICLRVPLDSSAKVFPPERQDVCEHAKWRNVWTAHCIVNPMKSVLTKEQNVKVYVDVHQYCAEPPENIINPVEEGLIPATVEFLGKTLPDRRMEMAVNRLGDATSFCQTIVLGKPFQEEDQIVKCKVPDSLDIFVKEEDDKPPLPRNNSTQSKAINTALMQKFTLIQGPPGTGKTLTGVKLVYWFNEMNKSKQSPGLKRQVMYCGPSNSAVDVAAKQMMYRLREKCPKIIRVYSELLENQVFPLPRDAMVITTRTRRYEMGGNKDLENISLHHLVRKDQNPFARKILHFDRKFKKTKPEDITDEEVETYQKLVTDASVHELKKHEVILCTASVSASPRILKATRVYQCVIDECGMCMEAETLVPLVSHKPEQVVLIGDHKQLRPIVVNNVARELGLEISMFERQAMLIKEREGKSLQSKARRRQMAVAETRERHGLENNDLEKEEKSAGLIMLDLQYRMHHQICDFPSRHFYEGKLRTKLTSWWSEETETTSRKMKRIWPNRNAPIVFCHVEGAEQTLTVSTDEGSEQSKSNRLEIDEVVRIYREFRYEHGVRPRDITVLSQYKAQCKQIEKELIEEEQSQGYTPSVSTVVASQGDEWDFVILSTVRSLPRYEIDKKPTVGWLKRNLGFITDHHQINVALTRARRGLVIVGNKHLLKCDGGENGLWEKLLVDYDKKGAIVDAGKFPRLEEEASERRHIYEGRNWGANLAPRLREAMKRQYKLQN